MNQNVQYNQTMHDFKSGKNEERLYIRNECKIMALEIDSFTMSIFKYFCLNGNFDVKETYNTIASIDHWCKAVKNEIFMVQLRKYQEGEPSVMDATPSAPGDNDESIAFVPRYHQPGSFTKHYNKEISKNLKALKKTSQRNNRLSMGEASENSVEEGIRNIEATETNLLKFNNMVNLSENFPLRRELNK